MNHKCDKMHHSATMKQRGELNYTWWVMQFEGDNEIDGEFIFCPWCGVELELE